MDEAVKGGNIPAESTGEKIDHPADESLSSAIALLDSAADGDVGVMRAALLLKTMSIMGTGENPREHVSDVIAGQVAIISLQGHEIKCYYDWFQKRGYFRLVWVSIGVFIGLGLALIARYF